jgi:hypothetical protein
VGLSAGMQQACTGQYLQAATHQQLWSSNDSTVAPCPAAAGGVSWHVIRLLVGSLQGFARAAAGRVLRVFVVWEHQLRKLCLSVGSGLNPHVVCLWALNGYQSMRCQDVCCTGVVALVTHA